MGPDFWNVASGFGTHGAARKSGREDSWLDIPTKDAPGLSCNGEAVETQAWITEKARSQWATFSREAHR
jgi:hypothetical protein